MNIIKLSYMGSGNNGESWEHIPAVVPLDAAKYAHKMGFTFLAEYVNDELDALYQFNFQTLRFDKVRSNLIYERSQEAKMNESIN